MNQNNLIAAASFVPRSLQSPGTWVGHLPFAAWVIREIAPGIFVELGTHSGNSYFTFCQAVVEAGLLTQCYAVDTWLGDEHAGLYSEDIFARVNKHNAEYYAGFSRLLRMTFDDAVIGFADESINLLHIDGMHTYEAVRHDFDTWLPKLAPGAVVIFHDTNVHERNFGVWKFWKELQARYPRNIEFLNSFGLGVLQLNNALDDQALEWLQTTADEKQGLIRYFVALGSRQWERFESNELKKEAGGLTRILSEHDMEIGSLHKALAERDLKISSLSEAIMERDAQIANLNQSLVEQGRRITEFLSSTSWKITWPLRIIGQQLKRFRHMDLRRRIACLLGIRYWQDGVPKISQGFAGEELSIPGANVDNPLISAVMPAYNACRSGKKHFLSALESVANQSYRNIELIIVDDGSTDDTRQVCNDFLSTRPDLRARYLNKKNGGQSSARNFGVQCCSGEYISFIDQDDEWYTDKLEKIVPWLGDKSIDVLYTDADTIDSEGNVIHHQIHQNLLAGWPHPKRDIEDILFRDIFVMPGLMTLKKAVFAKVGGFDENLSGYEDDDLFLRLFENGRIFYLPVPTLRWRFHGANYSFSSRMLKSRLYYWRKLLKNYTDNGANHVRDRRISLRFFWEFIFRALDQYEAGNVLYESSMDGARDILPHLPRIHRFLFGFIFLLPMKFTMSMLILPIKVLNFFK
ncbi:MAG: glycosyltransferase [Deltaproteobacteria bacterium]|nr:glycosyltransferase [Deltaproteobacteria bacterium]